MARGSSEFRQNNMPAVTVATTAIPTTVKSAPFLPKFTKTPFCVKLARSRKPSSAWRRDRCHSAKRVNVREFRFVRWTAAGHAARLMTTIRESRKLGSRTAYGCGRRETGGPHLREARPERLISRLGDRRAAPTPFPCHPWLSAFGVESVRSSRSRPTASVTACFAAAEAAVRPASKRGIQAARHPQPTYQPTSGALAMRTDKLAIAYQAPPRCHPHVDPMLTKETEPSPAPSRLATAQRWLRCQSPARKPLGVRSPRTRSRTSVPSVGFGK